MLHFDVRRRSRHVMEDLATKYHNSAWSER